MKPLLDFRSVKLAKNSVRQDVSPLTPGISFFSFFFFFYKGTSQSSRLWVIMCRCDILKWAWLFETQQFFSARNSYLKSHRSVVIHLIESQTVLSVAATPLKSPFSVRNQTWRRALFPSLWLQRLLYHCGSVLRQVEPALTLSVGFHS